MPCAKTGLLHDFLEEFTKKKVILKVNQNKSTYLSVSYPRDDLIKASIHQIFLTADQTVLFALAKYVQGSRGKKNFAIIKAYVHEQDNLAGYTTNKKVPPLKTKGEVYDLEEILRYVESFYFDEQQLGLNITWYTPKKRRKRFSRSFRQNVTFGEYHAPLKLVKINTLIDNWEVPKVFVSFIVYHEVLHHIHPPKVGETGKSMIHHKEFKKAEKEFLFYDEAMHWKQEYMQNFLDKNHRC